MCVALYIYVSVYEGVSILYSGAMHIVSKCTNIYYFNMYAHTNMYLLSQAQKDILHDFFTHAFDGSGGDNFFDAGIVILCGVVHNVAECYFVFCYFTLSDVMLYVLCCEL